MTACLLAMEAERRVVKWSLLLFGLVAVAGTASACEGLSPGDLLDMGDHTCTLGFLVANKDGLYFTTAGHCIDAGQRAATPGVGEWGTGVFHFLEPDNDSPQDGAPGMDFALIEVDPDVYDALNPKMCGWDGPTGIYNETPGEGMVGLYGHSMVFGDAGRLGLPTYRREGVLNFVDEDRFYFTGPSLMGDSGSAVLHQDGRALGVLTHLSVGLGGTNGGTHIERGFRLAAEEGFTDLRLVLMGEDPVAILRELAGAPTASTPAEPAPPTSANATSPSKPASPSRPPAATNGTSNANDSISPAATADKGEESAATRDNATPFVPPAALALVLALALALRRRHRV